MQKAPCDISIDPEVLNGFIEESLESLAALDSLFLQIERNPQDVSPVHNIFRAIHSLKGNAPFFGFMKMKALAHDLESLLAFIRDGSMRATPAIITHLLTCVDEFKAMLTRLHNGGAEVLNPTHHEALLLTTRKFLDRTAESSLVPETPPVAPVALAQTNTEASAAAPKSSNEPMHKSIRIAEERIDTFLAFVGELIIVGEMLRHLSQRVQNPSSDQRFSRDLFAINEMFSQLSSGLEKAIMSIRKVSLKPLLQKVPRLVRDIAQAKGKQIVVEIVGEDTEIDKSLLDLLDAPLTHMVRNAADHGIETPEQRKIKNKEAQGKITINCREEEKFIVLEVKDDGAGLNYEGLTKKALSLGLINEGQKLGEEEVVNLLFMAGVSTAAEVSDISGRGVGMDVVKRSIESAGGSIKVESHANEGSTFTVKLTKSVTTQIIQGYVVEVGGNSFVLPLERVVEAWRLEPNDVVNVLEQIPCIQRHGGTLPLLDLGAYLGFIDSKPQSKTVPYVRGKEYADKLAVTLVLPNNNVALVVDGVLGIRQLVLKTIEGLELESKILLGGALLGNGSIALVLDTDRLVQLDSSLVQHSSC
jgi:two-component system chemotaxis sensor kinase CheA